MIPAILISINADKPVSAKHTRAIFPFFSLSKTDVPGTSGVSGVLPVGAIPGKPDDSWRNSPIRRPNDKGNLQDLKFDPEPQAQVIFSAQIAVCNPADEIKVAGT